MLDVNLNTNWTVENVIHIKGEIKIIVNGNLKTQ